jgi:hypothetical protein
MWKDTTNQILKITCKDMNWVHVTDNMVQWLVFRRSQWLHGLRHEPPSPGRTLGSWVRVPLQAWMSVYAFILCLCYVGR